MARLQIYREQRRVGVGLGPALAAEGEILALHIG
jgi:hypothetical protein